MPSQKYFGSRWGSKQITCSSVQFSIYQCELAKIFWVFQSFLNWRTVRKGREMPSFSAPNRCQVPCIWSLLEHYMFLTQLHNLLPDPGLPRLGQHYLSHALSHGNLQLNPWHHYGHHSLRFSLLWSSEGSKLVHPRSLFGHNSELIWVYSPTSSERCSYRLPLFHWMHVDHFCLALWRDRYLPNSYLNKWLLYT